MAMKLASPLMAVGVGGGLTAVAQFGLDQITPDGTGGVKDKISKWSQTIGLALGLAGTGALFALTKDKEAAFISGLSALSAGVPAMISEVRANSAKPAAAPATAPATAPAATGTGVAIATRRGFGAPPVVDLFANDARNVQMLGPGIQAPANAATPQFSPSAFGASHF